MAQTACAQRPTIKGAPRRAAQLPSSSVIENLPDLGDELLDAEGLRKECHSRVQDAAMNDCIRGVADRIDRA
jgi:hypothetical protein